MLNKQQLKEFISSGDFETYDFLPITAHRALSHLKNPNADENQTLLILAFDDERLAGYLGCLPDQFTINNRVYKYAWLSTLYISPEFRGKKIAQALLNKAIEDYEGNIALSEFTKEAEGLFNKIAVLQYIEFKAGKRYYFRSDMAEIIPAKKPSLKIFKPVFSIADRVLNAVISVKNRVVKKPDFKFEIHNSIDSESSDFILRFNSLKNAEEINWFIENPWVLEGSKEDKRYLFSSFSKTFRYFWIKIYDDKNNLMICSLLLLRDSHLKILYLFSENNQDTFIRFLRYFIVKNNVKTVTSYQAELNKKIAVSSIFPSIYQRDFERRYMFHEQFAAHLPADFKPEFQDGDGDCAMT